MRLTKPYLLLISTLLSSTALAQNNADWAFKRKFYNKFEVKSLDEYELIENIEIDILKDVALQQLTALTINYQQGNETLKPIVAYTLKPDGRKIEVEQDKILTKDAVSGNASMYFQDMKVKTIFFPDMQVGDRLVLQTSKTVRNNNLPQVLSYGGVFAQNAAFAEVKIEIISPKALNLKISSPEMVREDKDIEDKNMGDKQLITLTKNVTKPTRTESFAPLGNDYEPRVFVTNLTSYEELGQKYYALAAPKARVTPEVQTLADTITQGMNDPQKQAQAIFDWMVKNIRYVAVYIGSGRNLVLSEKRILITSARDKEISINLMLRRKFGINAVFSSRSMV